MQNARLLTVFALALGACDDATSLSDTAADASPPDAAADAGVSPLDALSRPPDAADLRGAFGEPCEDGAECLSGYCVEGPEAGRICSQLCGTCPDGFECSLIGNAGADMTFICTVDRPDLCKRCQTDRECDDTEDLCVPIGNGHYCGEDCAADDRCPDGYTCVDVFDDTGATKRGRQCVPAGGEGCLPCRDADGDGYGDGGDCRGADCADDDPQTYTGAPELCDGHDNNCNSLTDELELLQVPVDLAPCLSLGVCAGAPSRCRDGVWACDYPGTYEEEETRCDLSDNDCDGTVDEGFDLQTDPANCGLCGRACAYEHAEPACVAGVCERGPCEEGWHDANGNDGDGCEYLCVPTFGGVEICDGLDNDCNGAVDDGFDRGETCDGFDNDCDGQTDEDFDLDADASNCGDCGVSCGAPHADVACEAAACVTRGCEEGWHDANGDPSDGCEYGCFVSAGGAEQCDLVDNDCDGDTDEDFNLVGDTENCGACGLRCVFPRATPLCVDGACRIDRCDEGYADADGEVETGCEYRCDRTNGGLEMCDRLDNDCDGQIDEGIDLLTDDANCGACDHRCQPANAAGRCIDGSCILSECLGGFQDLDGLAENGCEYGCFASNEGLEACDNIDNDCDGDVDEDFDLQADLGNCGFCGRTCATPNAQWLCDAGRCAFQGCDEGFHDLNGVAEDGCEFACVLQNGGVEACNGVDDDCDAQVDEGLLNACGQCGPTPDEVCNGADDDCDGQTDEGLLNACGQCGPAPAEVCDFVDNDCDGQTDEGLRNRCNGCGPEPGEVCNGVDDDCDGLTDNHGVCGPYIQSACRWFVGWSDENNGPGGASAQWGGCPASDKWYGGNVRCVGTRRDGLFMHLDLNGDVDDNDRLAFAFLCDDPGNPGLAGYIETHCAAYLGYSDNNRGPDGVASWGACPPSLQSDVPGLRCTSSGFDRLFRKINLEGDVDGNDDFSIAFKCFDGADPGRAWSLQQSVDLFMGWADRDIGPGDGSPTWGACPGAPSGDVNGLRCTSSRGDGNYHRLDTNGNVNDDDDFGFALRSRPAP